MEYTSPSQHVYTSPDEASALPARAYGVSRNRSRRFGYGHTVDAAQTLLAAGSRPTVKSVRETLGGGNPAYIARDLKKFWKKQASLQMGVPASLAFLPVEIADAARAQWELALVLAQQAAKSDDNEARAQLQQMKRETELQAGLLELREKEWRQVISDQEESLQHSRKMVNDLMKALAEGSELQRQQGSRIAQLQSEIEGYRQQLANLCARAINKHQASSHSLGGDKKRRQVQSSKPKRKR